MIDWKRLTPRRSFLGRVAGGVAALGLTNLAGPLELAAAADQGTAKQHTGAATASQGEGNWVFARRL